ncbi:MAG: 30S ribosomal protein S15 [Nanoarchaeota archaeon]|nr:30S ribosomal protein S15 [Nanoarchaeota archaeon]
MARMYARKKGKSGSKKPLIVAQWTEYKKEEIEKLILKLSKNGMATPEIGRTLKDQYGIPSVKAVTGKSVLKILNENKAGPELPEDLINLLRKSVLLHDHMKINKKDNTSKHGLELLESKIRRLVKYYIKTKKLPVGWKYNADKAKLIVQTTK